ncbi:hypothetical protein [Nigerium massiliense]|uniref:hypothetical protein n=1 Tax=Nigerium massiliense TaxID=1522317 RepID=UPI00059112AF|nr:hypothetical protein [Nigerium massiliense]
MSGADAREALQRLRILVADARPVPMSASCFVNRAEVLALVDRVAAGLGDDTGAAARAEADGVLADARARADELVSDAEVVRRAKEEAAELRSEADSYVDERLAELEAGLSRTMAELTRMRRRLSERAATAEGRGQDDVAGF